MKLRSRNIVDAVLLLSLATTLQVACSPTPPCAVAPTEGEMRMRGACSDAAPPAPAPAPAPRPSRSDCFTACANLRTLRCKLAEATPRGASCEAVCKNVEENNAGAGFNVACLSSVKSCGDIDACR